MPELKRTFNSAKMNRDIDDRLLHPGEYRYAMNVNIGESEGGDIGAVENLKGNELIAGQELLNGTTIGVVRDPNNDRIYWFNKGEEVDGIYEYDERTGMVNPILLDRVSNPLQKPSCAPNFVTPIDTPASDGNTRPPLPTLPPAPVGGCTDPSAENYSPGVEFDDGSCTFAPPPPPTSLGVSIANSMRTVDNGTMQTLTATPTNVLGTAAYSWDSGETTQSITVTGTNQVVTGTVTLTDSGRTSSNTSTANYAVTFVDPTLPTYNFSWGASGSISGVTISGGISMEEGTENVDETISGTITLQPDSGRQWLTLPTVTTSPALPSGVTGGDTVVGTVGSANAASVSISGTWTPTADYSGTATFTGGSTEAIPATETTYTINGPTNTGAGFVVNLPLISTALSGTLATPATVTFRAAAGSGRDFAATPTFVLPGNTPSGTTAGAVTTIARPRDPMDGSFFLDLTGEVAEVTVTVTEQPIMDTTITPAWENTDALEPVTGDTAGSVNCFDGTPYTDSGTVTVAAGQTANITLSVTNPPGSAGSTVSTQLEVDGRTFTHSATGFSVLADSAVVGTLSAGTYNWTLTGTSCAAAHHGAGSAHRSSVSFTAQ